MTLPRTLILLLLATLSGCAPLGPQPGQPAAPASGAAAPAPATAESAQAAIAAAEAAVRQAEAVDGLWRDTTSVYLAQARLAASRGFHKIAIQLAETARFEAEMGYQQAVSQRHARPWLF